MKIKSYWLKLAAGLVLITLLLTFRVKISDVGKEVAQSDPFWIVLAGGMHNIGLALSAYRWQLLLSAQAVEAPFWGLFSSYLIGGFFNNFLPTRVGGDVYRMVDSKKYSGTMLRPFAVIIVERLTGIYGLLLIGIAALAFYPRFQEVKPLAIALFTLTVSGFLAVFVFYGSDRFGAWLKRVVVRLPEKVAIRLSSVFDSFWHFSRAKSLVFFAFLLGLLLQFNVVLYYYFIARGLHMPLSFLETCIVMPILICIQLLPLTPNGIGVREFSYIYLLKGLGVTEGMAVAFSVWDYILTFAYGVVGGILYLFKK